MREVLGGIHRTQAHAAGRGGKEERAVHDGEGAGGSRRGGLLQDTAFQPDFQIIRAKGPDVQGGYPEAGPTGYPLFSWEKRM